MNREQDFVACLIAQYGKPYQWDGKGPDVFDCSGLGTYALKAIGGPDHRNDWNCERMWWELAPVSVLRPGTCAFYHGVNKDAPEHVVYWVEDGVCIGACGGDSSVTTPEAAKLRGARVRLKRSHLYRPGFMGFRRIQWLDQ